jgi:EamA domain-containing membrane protein RarD
MKDRRVLLERIIFTLGFLVAIAYIIRSMTAIWNAGAEAPRMVFVVPLAVMVLLVLVQLFQLWRSKR